MGYFFKWHKAPSLLKTVQHVLAIPPLNTFMERVFGVIENNFEQWKELSEGWNCRRWTNVFELQYEIHWMCKFYECYNGKEFAKISKMEKYKFKMWWHRIIAGSNLLIKVDI